VPVPVPVSVSVSVSVREKVHDNTWISSAPLSWKIRLLLCLLPSCCKTSALRSAIDAETQMQPWQVPDPKR